MASVTAQHSRRREFAPRPVPHAGIFYSPQSGLRLPTYCPEDHPSTRTLDSTVKNELRVTGRRDWSRRRVSVADKCEGRLAE